MDSGIRVKATLEAVHNVLVAMADTGTSAHGLCCFRKIRKSILGKRCLILVVVVFVMVYASLSICNISFEALGGFLRIPSRRIQHTEDRNKTDHFRTPTVIYDQLQTNYSTKESVEEYFTPRKEKNKMFDQVFRVVSGQVCSKRDIPTVIIICLTLYSHVEQRHTIRSTWGSVVRTRSWPNSQTRMNLKLLFLSGNPGRNLTSSVRKGVAEEIMRYKDVVVIDMAEDYRHLSTKVITGLRWVQTFCPKTKFVMKTDEDTFIHVPNLINVLNSVSIGLPSEGLVAGYVLTAPFVVRNRRNRWYIGKEIYPFTRYPLYAAGCAYVITGSTIPRLVDAAKHMPYIGNEDAFVTGILRTVVGAKLIHVKGFTRRGEAPATPCEFFNNVRVAGTNTNDAMKRTIWSAMRWPVSTKNCYRPENVIVPDMSLDKWVLYQK